MLAGQACGSGIHGYSGGDYYYIGSTYTVNYGDGLFHYDITAGIPVPGTHGSILGETSDLDQAEENTSGGTRITFNYVTPRIYMGSAWLLNLDFDTFDSLKGMTMKAYTVDGGYVKATTYSSGTEYYTRTGVATAQTADGSTTEGDVTDETGNAGDGTDAGSTPGTTATLATRYRYVKVSNPTEDGLANYYVKSDTGYDPDNAMTASDYQSRYVLAAKTYSSGKTYYQKLTYETYLPYNSTGAVGKDWIPFNGNNVYQKNADGSYSEVTGTWGDRYRTDNDLLLQSLLFYI